MKWSPKDSKEFILGLRFFVFVFWIILIAASVVGHFNVSKKVHSLTEHYLNIGYKNQKEGLLSGMKYSDYEKLKKDSIRTSVIKELKQGGTVTEYYGMYRGWNFVGMTVVFIFLTTLLFVFFEFLKAPFTIREEMETLNKKIDLIFANTVTLKEIREEES